MKRFKRIYIEITNICNLECSFCPKTSRRNDFMSRELFGHILSEIHDYTNYLYFHVMGEPLLHPDLEYFLEICGKYGIFANITTNGTLIKQASERIIHQKALRLINFSLHSLENRQIQEGSYLQDIFEFAELARKENPKFIICLRLWNYSHKLSSLPNQEIISAIKAFFKYPDEIREIPQLGNGLKLRENLYLSQSERFEWPDMQAAEEISPKGFCLGLRDQIAILVDGTVVPCCLDSEGSINLGNIRSSDFSGIINSVRAIQMHEGFNQRKLTEALCRKCSYRKRFD